MSKRRLHEDDIYVAPYTRSSGRYRYVSGHYRRSRKHNSEPPVYEKVPTEIFIWGLIIFFPFIIFSTLIPILIRDKKWLLCLMFVLYTIINIMAYSVLSIILR